MTTTEKFKNIDIKEQVFKIIGKYAFSNSYVVKNLANIDNGIYEFINIAYLHFVEYYLDRYDESKGHLATYIYSTLSHLTHIFVCQVQYSVDFSTARTICNPRYKETSGLFKYNLYCNTKSLDSCISGINMKDNIDVNSSFDVKENITYSSALADDNNIDDFIDNEYNNYIVKLVLDCLDKYINYKYKFSASKYSYEEYKNKMKDIILSYFFIDDDTITYQKFANKYSVSREQVRHYINDFKDYLKRDKNFRAYLKSRKKEE